MTDEVEMTCGECFVVFCMPTRMYESRLKDHQSFYCPNGHARYFFGKTKEEKRIEELERARDSYVDRMHAWMDRYNELLRTAQTCPICGWHSHASPERLWKSLIRHFVRIHSRTRFEEVPELVEQTS